MKRINKKFISLLLSCVLLLSAAPMYVFAFKVDPKIQIIRNGTEIISCSTLASAVDDAQDGDVISIAGEVLSYTSTENINITKNITLKTGEYFGGSAKYLQYNGTSAPLFTVKNGATFTVTDSIIYGNTNSVNLNGGLIRVENGGKLIIDGSTSISGFKLNGQGSKGGVIFASNGGKVTVNSVTFSGNYAAAGKDIYAENKDDVTIKSGVTADVAYGEFKTPGIEPSPDSTAVIDYDKKIIYGIDQNLKSLDTYIDTTKSGLTVSCDTEVIGTGTTVSISENGKVIETYTAVLFGDVDGDGQYNGTDAVIVNCVANGMLTKEQVGEAEYMAADCNHDNVIDENDVDILIDAGLLLTDVKQTTK